MLKLHIENILDREEKIMAEWMKTSLIDIVDLVGGGTPKTSKAEYWGGNINWLSVKDFNNEKRYVYSTEKTITEEGLNNSSTKLLKKDDIIISARGTVGELAMIPFPMAFNQSCYGIRSKEGTDSTFLYYLIKNSVRMFKAMTHGSVFDTITRDTFANIEVVIPDIEMQHRIAKILADIDDKIENNERINDNLEQQAQALFKSWFVDFEPFNGTMPSDWEIVPLEKIADFQNGYAFKSKELLNEPSSDCYQVFKQGHIARGGGFIPDGTKSWYPKRLASKLEKFVLKKGDILMAMTDMKDNVAILGNTAIMPLDNEYIVNQRVGHLRANGYKGVTYPFIYLLTNSTDFLVDLRSRANSGVQVNLSSSEIKASQTVLPSEEVNNAFSEITLPMFEIIINNQLENQRLAQLRDTLLPKLMSSELDVSNIEL